MPSVVGLKDCLVLYAGESNSVMLKHNLRRLVPAASCYVKNSLCRFDPKISPYEILPNQLFLYGKKTFAASPF